MTDDSPKEPGSRRDSEPSPGNRPETADSRFQVSLQNLRQKAVRGAAVTGTSYACNLVVRLGSTMVLARLLAPEDFGLVALAGAIIVVIAFGGDLGLSEASIQKADVTHDQLTALFWVNVGMGIVLALVNAALAPVLVLIYGDERILWISIVLGAEFVFRGLGYQQQAFLNRMLRFRAVALSNMVAMVLGTALAIVGAALGFGYWALVIGQLSPPLIFLVAMWAVCEWRPGLPRFPRGMRSLLAFGANLTLFNMLEAAGKTVDRVLIGSHWGAHLAGVYSKGYQLVYLAFQQVFNPIARVAVPALSRLVSEPARYERYYCKAVTFLGYATMPVLVLMAVLVEEVVQLILGPQWVEGAPIMLALCVGMFGKAVVDSTHWVVISTGKTGRLLKWALTATPLMCGAFVIGVRWGALGVAWAYAISAQLLNIVKFGVFLRHTPVSTRAALRAMQGPAILSILMFPALYQVRAFVSGWSPWLVCLITGAAAAALFLLGLLAWPKAKRDILDLMSTLKLLRQRSDHSGDLPGRRATVS